MKKSCPNCQEELSEVRDVYLEGENIYLIKDVKTLNLKFSLYPIHIKNPSGKRTYKEYRFICIKCKEEFTYSTLTKKFEPLSLNSEFMYSWEIGCLVKRKA